MTIQEILAKCPPQGSLVIKANVYYDNPRRIVVTAYRPDGEIWTNINREEFPHDMSDVQFQAAIEKAGLSMTQRPVKQAGVSYHYFVARTGDLGYNTRSAHAQAAERKEQENAFNQFRAFERFQEVMNAN